ncbi:MAG: Translation initiation factor 2 [uncultured Thiotrichaceae bacterium]|uniref:Translation initiation factor IF-2 n=1 Tax=uncultured Thiotrichaceae bacterium TaxID=298394 RepID=A0A6S6TTJ8_9GAMM|nr:MAG: Translation initiation factor 2 [uncultured Thiotrichaceae bacterium]
MSDIEVSELAKMVKAPVDVLMRQLKRAGVEVSSPEDKITDAQKLMLLEGMRESVDDAPASGGKKITLKSRSAAGGAKKPGIEVRRKKTLGLRKDTAPAAAAPVDVAAEARADELARQAEQARLERESLIQKAEQGRRELEASRLRRDKGMPEPEQPVETPVSEPATPEVADAPAEVEAKVAAETPVAPVESAPEVVPAPVEQAKVVEAEAKPEPVAQDNAPVETPAEVVVPVQEAAPVEAVKPAPKNPMEMTAKERHEAVTNAARRDAASALKRRPSRAKLKAEEAARAAAEAAKVAASKPAEKKAEPAKPAAPAKPGATAAPAKPGDKPASPAAVTRKDKKKIRTRERENPRGNVRGGNNRRGGKREVKVDRGEVKHGFEMPTAPVVHEIEVPATIVVTDLAQKLSIRATDIIKAMMKMGMMVTINQVIDQETAMLVTEELGHIAKPEKEMDDDALLAGVLGEGKDFAETVRPPVVTIMGHVDHGKTSLLDYIRESRVASGEAGGITQHIGAYHVDTDQGTISFLDTPGHAAFTQMRERGAQVTDIIILIVAADDGVMPQTKEAIKHAKAAGVPMIVAINKMDKDGADADRVLSELSQNEVLTEDWGGDVPVARISAKTGDGVDALLETILLVAEVQELTAAVDAPAKGTVIEASIERGRGVVATVLVREGTLRKGDILLCGTEYGRVRALFDEAGRPVKEAGPSIPVSVLGLSAAPEAGDEAFVVSDERKAREVADVRREKQRDTRFAAQQSTKLDNMLNQMESPDKQQVNLLVKGDVQGSVEAIRSELAKLSTDEIEVRIIASGVGGMNGSDIDLAAASKAIVIAFNVRADGTARKNAQESDVEIRYYSIIYDVINDVRNAMSGMLSPETKEVFTGLAEVKDVFKSSEFGQVAGCLVVDGAVRKGNPIRVLRDNVVIFEGELESLRRHRDDVKEVSLGTECGIAVKNYNDVQAGDQIEVFEYVEVARTI